MFKFEIFFLIRALTPQNSFLPLENEYSLYSNGQKFFRISYTSVVPGATWNQIEETRSASAKGVLNIERPKYLASLAL